MQAPKDISIAYLFWFMGGLIGAHRLYLGRTQSALLYMFTAGLFGVGWIYDFFHLPGMVEAENARLAVHTGTAMASDSRLRVPIPGTRRSPKDHLRIVLCKTAAAQGGSLSVTEGVIATGRSHEEVEALLDEMAKRRWVDIDNHPDSGVVVYRFTELGG